MNVLTQWREWSLELLSMILYYNVEVILRLNALNPLIKCLNLILIYILHACSFLTLVHISLNIVCRRAGPQNNLQFEKSLFNFDQNFIFI